MSGWKKEVVKILGGGGEASSSVRWEAMFKTLGEGQTKQVNLVWRVKRRSKLFRGRGSKKSPEWGRRVLGQRGCRDGQFTSIQICSL